MKSFTYIFLAIAHGIIFTLNIILAINLAPILDAGLVPGDGSPAALFGFLMCLGTIISSLITLGVYMEDLVEIGTIATACSVHSAILAAMAYSYYYYVSMLIS